MCSIYHANCAESTHRAAFLAAQELPDQDPGGNDIFWGGKRWVSAKEDSDIPKWIHLQAQSHGRVHASFPSMGDVTATATVVLTSLLHNRTRER